jgi:hypothetical protein
MVVRPAQALRSSQQLAVNAASYWRWFGGYGLYAPGRHDLPSHP